MISPLFAALLLLQGAPPAPPQQLPESPVRRIVVANLTVEAQDTLRLLAQAMDAQGNAIPTATFRFVGAGNGRFEARVTEDGLFTSGAPGPMPVTVVATVPGTRPFTQTLQVSMVPAPAAKVELARSIQTMMVGQRFPLEAKSFSRHGDPRADRITVGSSRVDLQACKLEYSIVSPK